MNHLTHPFTAVVLAGGRSTRMGRDKALLPLPMWAGCPHPASRPERSEGPPPTTAGTTTLARQLATLRAAGATELLVSARPEQNLPLDGARLVPDLHPDSGPLAGIAAALATAAHDRVLVLAIDLAQMPAEFLAALAAAASPDCGLVPLHSGQPEPLAAVYPRSAAQLAAQALAAGERRPREWARQLAALGLVRWHHLSPAEATHFANWNTPGDLAAARPATG